MRRATRFVPVISICVLSLTTMFLLPTVILNAEAGDRAAKFDEAGKPLLHLHKDG